MLEAELIICFFTSPSQHLCTPSLESPAVNLMPSSHNSHLKYWDLKVCGYRQHDSELVNIYNTFGRQKRSKFFLELKMVLIGIEQNASAETSIHLRGQAA